MSAHEKKLHLITFLLIAISCLVNCEEFEFEKPKYNEKTKTIFVTFFAKNPSTRVNLTLDDEKDILPHFEDDQRITVIAHGFKTSGEFVQFMAIKDSLFKLEEEFRPDVVIIIDWRARSNANADKYMGYKAAARSTKPVGNEVAYFLNLLRHNKELNPEKIHLIGFSLGAHLVGVVGRLSYARYKFPSQIARITALDPAGPRFESFGGYVNKDDARFVDVIHTNGGNSFRKMQWGMRKAVGHVDFYPNGGLFQPNCAKFDLSCSHNRATHLFEASFRHNSSLCEFYACKAEDYKSWMKSPNCSESVRMGFYAFLDRPRGNYYLQTSGKEPFCKTDVILKDVYQVKKPSFAEVHLTGLLIGLISLCFVLLVAGVLFRRRRSRSVDFGPDGVSQELSSKHVRF